MDFNQIQFALGCCGRFQAIKHAKSLHSLILKLGLFNNVFLLNNMISVYAKCSHFDDAQTLFEEMPHRNIISYTTMVSAFTNSGRPHEALTLYNHMLESKTVQPNQFLYSAVLKACSLVGDVELGKLVHRRISQARLEFDTVLMNVLLDMYVKCGNLSDAKRVFHEIACKSSTSWNTLILGHARQGLMRDALNLFDQMPDPDLVSWNSIITGLVDNASSHALQFVSMMHGKGLKLDAFTFPCALKACSLLGKLTMGRQIHCCIIKSGFECSCYCISALIDMYSNCKLLDEAMEIFDKNPPLAKSLAIWNSMLSGYVTNGDWWKAFSLISRMHHSGAQFDYYTFSIALKVCIYFNNLRLASQVHGLVITCGYELDYVVGSILIDLYAKQGNINNALRLFERLPDKDVVAWSSLIAGCARFGSGTLAFSLFMDMVHLGIEIDHFVLSIMLKVSSSLSSLQSGKQIHSLCLKNGYESEKVITTALIDMYAKCGEMEDALALFCCLSEIDTMSWTGIIVGCAQNGRADEAISLLHKMIESGTKPNEITILGVLTACRHAGLVEEAWTIFNSIQTVHGLTPCPEHYNCMVDILAQAGCFEEARNLINDMPFKPDKTIWCSLLGACGTYKNRHLANIVAEHLLATSPEDTSVYIMLSNVYASLGMWDNLSKVREAVKKMLFLTNPRLELSCPPQVYESSDVKGVVTYKDLKMLIEDKSQEIETPLSSNDDMLGVDKNLSSYTTFWIISSEGILTSWSEGNKDKTLLIPMPSCLTWVTKAKHDLNHDTMSTKQESTSSTTCSGLDGNALHHTNLDHTRDRDRGSLIKPHNYDNAHDNKVSVLFEFAYGLLSVVDLQDAVYFAHWRLLLQPARVEYYFNYVLARVFWTQFRYWNSLVMFQSFSFHDLTTIRARTNATPQRRVSSEAKNWVYHHSALITTGESPEWHSPERATAGRS
ncbi:Pentatricopeptide repeat-containing protein, partial [Mucuna pruriens]